ncbi:hypothetical protein F5883DRAFT_546874 [Diaporthe sp. PMI_573]|nr:hypothetical protein F5883DRAFT_546874 [Diaporthaceae sp. PMI_573]
MSHSKQPAATSFHCFPQLPKELRRAIWRECLPSRVLDLDVPRADIIFQDLPKEIRGTVHCELSCTSAHNSRPPLITQVCFEAREVASETGGLTNFRDLWDGHNVNMWGAGGSIRRCWFDPARDGIHLNWDPVYEAEWMTTCEDPIPVLLSLGAKAARGASLPWETAVSSDDSMELLKQAGQSYMLCVYRPISIHATREDAVRSGLFSLLGEERVVLVDAADDARIRLFDDFNRLHGSSKDAQTAYFFQRWRDLGAEFLKENIQFWQTDWLYCESVVASPSWEKEDLDAVWTFIRSKDAGVPSTWIPDWDHEWVKKTLQELPHFRSVYMMRLCTEGCT